KERRGGASGVLRSRSGTRPYGLAPISDHSFLPLELKRHRFVGQIEPFEGSMVLYRGGRECQLLMDGSLCSGLAWSWPVAWSYPGAKTNYSKRALSITKATTVSL